MQDTQTRGGVDVSVPKPISRNNLLQKINPATLGQWVSWVDGRNYSVPEPKRRLKVIRLFFFYREQIASKIQRIFSRVTHAVHTCIALRATVASNNFSRLFNRFTARPWFTDNDPRQRGPTPSAKPFLILNLRLCFFLDSVNRISYSSHRSQKSVKNKHQLSGSYSLFSVHINYFQLYGSIKWN